MKYTIVEGDVVAFDMQTGEPSWVGKPDGRLPQEIMAVPNSDDCIVLVDGATGPKHLANLLRITPKGDVTWRAELPEPPGDAYTEMDWSSKGLTAYSWSGYSATIDLETGKIQRMEFVK
jgi:outer membrane protein assembly factor BamB